MINSPEFSWVPRKWIATWWIMGSSLLLWCSDCCLAPPRHHSVWSVVFFILAEVPLTPSLKVLNSFILSPCCWPQCVCLSTSHKPIHLLARKQWKLLWTRRWRWWWQQCPQHSQRSQAHRAGRCRSILAHECISAAKAISLQKKPVPPPQWTAIQDLGCDTAVLIISQSGPTYYSSCNPYPCWALPCGHQEAQALA